MELKTAIEILDYHQEWRLGKREGMIHEPKKLTEAINIVLSEVKKLLIHNVVKSLPQDNYCKVCNLPTDSEKCYSKRFEIDFDGNVLAGIEITNNEPKIFGAMNGWGNGISPDKCKITEKTD